MTDAGQIGDTHYRYLLWRRLSDEQRTLLFVMLNPSAATATESDPTMTRCVNFGRDYGYGAIRIVNLYARRSPYPTDIIDAINSDGAHSVIGPRNDRYIMSAARRATTIVCAWGGAKFAQARAADVHRMLCRTAKPLIAFGFTRSGAPRHPRGVRTTTAFSVFN